MNRAERFYATAGFNLIETGGGCTAFQKEMGEFHVLLTTRGDAFAPQSEHEPVLLGLYRNDADHSEPVGVINADNGEEAIRSIAANAWVLQ